jgi:serine/threonine-protein kinase RsbW
MMSSSLAGAHALPPQHESSWSDAEVRRLTDVPRTLEALTASMKAAGYSVEDLLAVLLSLEEAIVNGIQHGHHGDPDKAVRLRWHVTRQGVLATVQDQGPGFDPEAVADPLHPDNLERPSGRGLLLIRAHMTASSYSRPLRRLTMWRRRSSDTPAPRCVAGKTEGSG